MTACFLFCVLTPGQLGLLGIVTCVAICAGAEWLEGRKLRRAKREHKARLENAK